MNDVRRVIERDARVAAAAAELAKAARAVLLSAEAGRADAGSAEMAALRATLARYDASANG
jgi:hypothetical protein